MINTRFAIVLLGVLFVFGCQKDSSVSVDSNLIVLLKDFPLDVDQVNVDIQGVKVRYRGGDAAADRQTSSADEDWVWLNTHHGIYNLLKYQAGKTALLAMGGIPGGSIREIRLVLGRNHSIRINGKVEALELQEDAEAGFPVHIVKQMAIPRDTVTIDFNALLSVQERRNGGYRLIPSLTAE